MISIEGGVGFWQLRKTCAEAKVWLKNASVLVKKFVCLDVLHIGLEKQKNFLYLGHWVTPNHRNS
jgi:hypothetical protein